MTTLDKYWPSLANIDSCIRTEAETVDDAVLLAVHEPGPLRVRAANGSSEEVATEQDLLDALCRPADDGSAVLVAITGDSGVGKSHMVRWLHAQLQRHPLRDRLVIVLVPKTASLRQVVERILEPLEGDRYAVLKTELSKAIDALEPGAASQMLATAIAIELERKYEEGFQAIKEAGSSAGRDTKERTALTKTMREVLRDADVFDKWFGTVLQRIVRQAIEGGSESQTGELRRFTPEDLVVPDDWTTAMGKSSTNQALQQLTKNDGALRPLAADILQEALDPALRVVFRFSEALGQRTIEEIVDEIRRGLLVDGKELVLLIEDFAALAGIQQPLLNLMIAESDHQGRRVRAPLRTALAVTDGFLPSRQTILTRAKREWIIPNSADNEEGLIRRLTDLAGRYLNAARWGVDALRDHFAENAGTDLYAWVRPYQEPLSADESDMLRAFGSSSHGHPLFPLSSQAIASLSRRELRSGPGLRFNPRAFINNVLRDTLLSRSLHVKKVFPPPGFKEAVLVSGVEIALRSKAIPGDQKERLGPVLVYWAGNPSDLTSPLVPRGVFDAFGLPWPYSKHSPQPLPPGAKPTPKPMPTPAPAPQPPMDYIEAWATGNLAQQRANHVRQLLATAISDRIDWNSLRVRASAIMPGQIWLPFAPVGNPNTDPKFLAAEEVRPLCATLRGGVRALELWQANGRSWDYERSEDDYAIAQQLLDRLEIQVVEWHYKSALRQASALSRVLHRQALILRLTQRAEPPDPRLTEYFAPIARQPVPAEQGDNSPVSMVSSAATRAATNRVQVQRALLDVLSCFQGKGSVAYALDPQRLKLAWRTDLTEEAPQLIKPDLIQAREAANELLTGRLEVLLNRYRSAIEGLVPTVKELVGNDAEVGLVTPLRQLIIRARQAGLFPAVVCTSADADRAIDTLGTEEARSVFRHAVSFSAPENSRSLDFRLANWAAIDLDMLVRVHGAITLLDRVVQAMLRAASAQLEASGTGDIAIMVSRLKEGIAEVAQDLSA